MRETIAVMDRLNIIGVVSGPAEKVAAWKKARPERMIAAPMFDFQQPWLTPAQLRALHAAGALDAIGEIGAQYEGILPDDPKLEPYWALAEALAFRSRFMSAPGRRG